MKPLVLLLLLATLVAVAVLTSGPGPQTARAMHPCKTPLVAGDLWGDGAVQSSDAQALLIHVADAGYDHWCAPLDVDCNGNVTAVDALKILRYVAELGYAQHEPCPDVGTVIGGSGASAQYACGSTWFADVDGNNVVGSPDGTWILRRIAELPLPEGGGGCSSQDVDCNGNVTAVDALKILRYVAAMPYSQHEPCPDIGTDVDPSCPFDYPWPTTAAGTGATPTPPVPLVEFCNDTGQAADGLQFWAWTGGYPLHVLNVVSPPSCDAPSVTVLDPPSASLSWPTACVDDGETVSMRIGGCDNRGACGGPSVICFRWTAGGAPITSFQESSSDNPC